MHEREVLDMLAQTCTCRKWQLTRLPCKHAGEVIGVMRTFIPLLTFRSVHVLSMYVFMSQFCHWFNLLHKRACTHTHTHWYTLTYTDTHTHTLSRLASQNTEYGYVTIANRYSQRGKSLPWIPYAVVNEPSSRTHLQKTTRSFIFT